METAVRNYTIKNMFMNLFKGRSDAFYDGKICVHRKLTADIFEHHLKGSLPIGIYPITDDQKVALGVIDIDNKNLNEVEAISKICKAYELKPHVEISKSKGYHVWLFFDQAIEAEIVYEVLHFSARKANLTNYETFPKQKKLNPGQLGNAINLPYFNHSYAETRVFVDLTSGRKMTLEEFMSSVQYTDSAKIHAIYNDKCHQQQAEKETFTKIRKMRPCVQKLLSQGASEGERDNAAFCIMLELKQCGVTKEQIEEILINWNRDKNNPPLTNSKSWLESKLKEINRGYRLNCTKGQFAELLKSKCIPDVCQYKKTKIPATTFLENESIITEIIYNPELNSCFQFAVYHKSTNKWEITPKIGDIDINTTIKQRSLITGGTVLLPNGLTEYESTSILYNQIKAFIHDYLDIEEKHEMLAACYVLFTYVYDDFSRLPYLRVIGEAGSGKTRFLEVIGDICYRRTSITGAASTSSLFRIIEAFHGTVIIDEADVKDSSTTANIIKVLTCGYKKGSPVVCVGPTFVKKVKVFQLETYSTYSPKILATRKKFRDEGIESRCLTIEMYKPMSRRIPIILPGEFYKRASELRNKLLLFRLRNKSKTKLHEEFVDDSLEPRLNEIILPVISIMPDENIRHVIADLMREYNSSLLKKRQGDDAVEVISLILKLRNDNGPRIYLKALINRYNEDKKEKDQISCKKMGNILRKGLQMEPERTCDGTYIRTDDPKIEYWQKRYGLQQAEKVLG